MRTARRAPVPGPWLLLAAVLALIAVGAGSAAQPLPPIGNPTPSPTPSRTNTPTAHPSATPAPSAKPASTPTPTPRVATPATPEPPVPGVPTPSPDDIPQSSARPDASPEAVVSPAPSSLPGIPTGFQIPVIKRTPGRNTVQLVRTLEGATRAGIPLQQALIDGMGRFPVAGLAWYSDDWMAPRFTPFFHLHEGLDIFADFGTPIRAPDDGVVSRLTNGAIGGLAVWMTGLDGTQYYFAHMQEYANGIAAGTRVRTGAILGFVGDSGNAKGGAPHLHFEVHRPDAIPPKPIVDAWLDEAYRQAPAWVSAMVTGLMWERQLQRSEHTLAGLLSADAVQPQATPEYSILLTLLDPIGGSVGVLPRLSLVPASSGGGSTRLLDELIKLRVDGSLLTSFITGTDPYRDAG